MEGNIKAYWIIMVVATWVWFYTAMVGGSISEEELKMLKFDYKVVKFTTSGATRKSYSKFMEDLRRELASDYESHTIPVLRNPQTTPDSQRYVLVELTDKAGESITLALDVNNVYVVGYRVGDNSFFFDDAPHNARSNLFQGTTINELSFSGNYNALQTAAGTSRANIDLGISELDQAISSLYRTTSSYRTRARSLIVAIQMVSEAAQFKYIEQRVRASYDRTTGVFQSFRPDPSMLSLENKWGAMSTQIQQSKGGVFSRPIILQRINSEPLTVDCITTELMLNMALLLFMCKSDKTVSDYSDCYYQQLSPLLLRSMIISSGNNNDDDTCLDNIPEPLVFIIGRDNKCVDVKENDYSDGNAIILWPCKFNTDINQQWILKSDKTIRSNGKCLAAYGFSSGDHIMIYDCAKANKDSVIWEFDNDGTIKNPHSGLVLSATSGDSGTELTVQTNKNVPYQAWLPANGTTSNINTTTIVGYDDQCLQRNGPHTVWMQECDGGKYEQKWSFYQDGTIRPKLDLGTCLASEDDTQGSRVVIASCDAASPRQRWGFKNDGSFYNLDTKLVMEVKESDPSLNQIITWTHNGNPNQKWLPSYY